jgi:glycosyltransferase involved in cell wall biosynthesis
MAQPLVSVCLITYNHEKFIRRAIESVLRQRVNFKFEIVIGEDDSSDRTRDICQAIAEEYPDLINLRLRNREDVICRFGKPTGAHNFIKTLEDCNGKYIALLEGDDYWTSIHKLQSQFDLMESQSQYSGVFHDTHIVSSDDDEILELGNQDSELLEIYDLKRVLSSGSVAPTASMFFKRDLIFPLPKWFVDNPNDWKIEVMLALKAPLLKVCGNFWSAYMIHAGGIWSSETVDRQLLYRLDHVNDLYKVSSFKKHRKSLISYKAVTYEFGYQKVMKSNKRLALRYLWNFILLSTLPPWVKIKHLIKTSFRILFK